MWDRLDELLGRYMTPAMTEAGFRKSGARSYVLESPEGNLVFAEVRGFAPIPFLRFVIEWAAIPKTLREFHGGARARPQPEWGLLNGRLAVPMDMRDFPELSSEWSLDPERDFESFGACFEQALRSEAIPMWVQLLDRDHLAQRKGYGFYDGPGLREAILYIDDGDPAQVARWIDQACALNRHPDDTIVEWLRLRLAERRTEH